MEVELIRWPEDEHRREGLEDRRLPRLLLVASEAPPPTVTDALEDWIRLPAPKADVRARIDSLLLRAGAEAPVSPVLDEDGLLRFGSKWVALPPIEARLCGLLLERFGTVVGRSDLGQAGWPDGIPARNSLDVRVLRLRRRVESVDLAIRTVRSRGYLLEPAGSDLRKQPVSVA